MTHMHLFLTAVDTVLVLLLALTGVRLYREARRPRTTLDVILRLAKRERRGWRRRQLALRALGVPLNDVMIPENWPTLLLPGLRKIWHTRMRSRDDLYVASAQIYTPDTSERASESYQGVGEVGSDGWGEFQKTRRVPYAGFAPNFLATLTHKTFAKGIMVERELLEDNLYPQAGIPKTINQSVEKLADSASIMREKSKAALFNNAFTDTGVDENGFSFTGPDGVGLLSTAHPLSPSNTTVTQANEFTLALTGPNLSTVKKAMRKFTDDKGDLVSINPDTLIVPAALEDTANTLNNSPFVPGSNNNDVNPHYNKWKVIVWPHLTSDTAWFVVDSVLMDEHLIWLDRVKPEWQSEGDFDTIMAKYRGYFRFSRGWDAWQWIAGSTP